jgi:hypothetical protein
MGDGGKKEVVAFSGPPGIPPGRVLRQKAFELTH